MNHTFYMPAEWERHERTFVEWPVKESLVWPENYKEVCQGYAAVIQAIAKFEKVTVIANEEEEGQIQNLCGNGTEIVTIAHNDAWVRDSGPTFLWNEQRERAGVNWKFNSWGEKYLLYDLENKVAKKLLEHYQIPVMDAPFVLEGGSIHTDGEGTLLTTNQCLLHQNRNPDFSQAELEEYLSSYLGVEKIIWLKRGLFGDETDGHIDNVACFVRPGVIAVQTCSDYNDPNYEVTKENLKILQQETDARGRGLQIIEIPQPPARFYNGERLTLSYLNFYFVNDAAILPVFGEDARKTDQEAVRILQNLFPERTIVPVDGIPIIKEGGNVHCITQQMPVGQ